MKKLIRVAVGAEMPDLVLKNGKVINVYTGEIEELDIAIVDGKIAGLGHFDYALDVHDLNGAYVCPGLIDTHLHIESTMLSPANYAKTVMPYGVTTAIADPHEIANVCGMDGVDYMIAESESVPMDIRFMMPSCVPATPFEDNGAHLDAKIVRSALMRDDVFGLGEMMNYPGVLAADDEVLRKIAAARSLGKVVDGHYSGCDPKGLNAYCAFIQTDHECVTLEDAKSELQRGMYIQIRSGSATKNVAELVGIVNPKTLRRCLFCTDDKHVEDIFQEGHLDNNIRIAVNEGVDPIDAIIIATLNPSECYNLRDRGAIAPGRIADLCIFDDLYDFRVSAVYKNGALVAKNGRALFDADSQPTSAVLNTMNASEITEKDLRIPLDSEKVRVMRLMPHNVVTTEEIWTVETEDGYYKKTEGLSKVCVVERHKNTGNIGLGFIAGFGIQNGALAISVSHDSHNIICVGDNDRDMAIAVNEIIACGGGLTAVSNGEVFETFELPIAGLMSDRDSDYLFVKTKRLYDFARSLGVSPEIEPFMSLSFLSLTVIPEVKITDQGLFKIETFGYVPLTVE